MGRGTICGTQSDPPEIDILSLAVLLVLLGQTERYQ